MSEDIETSGRLLGANQHDNIEPFDLQDPFEGQLSDSEYKTVKGLLYTSHLLSSWNSRVFEFGAFLFLSKIYPNTLLPASVYALARAASAAILSPLLGSYIDKTNRLQVVRLSIVGQRIAVAASCAILFLLVRYESLGHDRTISIASLAILSSLACMEKLSWVMNTISVERDWVVIVAAHNEKRLKVLNAQMRRIDLFCKMFGPLQVALMDGISSQLAIALTGGMTAISVCIEYFTIARVYAVIPSLWKHASTSATPTRGRWTQLREIGCGMAIYIRHPTFLPSFALALLYLTVLSFSGQMITFLLTLGLSSRTIGVLRGVSALFELSATWIAPRIMRHIGPVRSGIWFINWELFCVAIACLFLWLDASMSLAAVGTITAVIASRVGLWGFDLCAQVIVQEEVEPERRGMFSSQEFALQNTFEMLAFTSTIVFPRPPEFRYPATISAAVVGLAGVLYAVFVRTRRGHLIHLSNCIDRNGKDHHHWWMTRQTAEREPEGAHEHELVSPEQR